jgi:hypothetical protein
MTTMDRFDTRAHRISRFVFANAQQLATGFRWIEELARTDDDGCLLLPRDLAMQRTEDACVSVYCAPSEPGYAGGLCIDGDGNLRSGTAGGVHRIDPDRRLPGKVLVRFPASSVAFGGTLRNRLWIGSRAPYVMCLHRRAVL